MKLISLLFVLGAIVLLAFISSTHWRNNQWDMAVFGIGLILVLGSAVPCLARQDKSASPILLDNESYHQARRSFRAAFFPPKSRIFSATMSFAGFLLVLIALIVWTGL